MLPPGAYTVPVSGVGGSAASRCRKCIRFPESEQCLSPRITRIDANESTPPRDTVALLMKQRSGRVRVRSAPELRRMGEPSFATYSAKPPGFILSRTHAEELPRITPMNANSRGDSERILVSIVSHHPVWSGRSLLSLAWIRVIRGQLNCSGSGLERGLPIPIAARSRRYLLNLKQLEQGDAW